MLQPRSHEMFQVPVVARPILPVETTNDESDTDVPATMTPVHQVEDESRLQEAVGYILDDCFFSIGQAVGDRKTVDQTAVMWWRDRYQQRFLRALQRFGNNWPQDRKRVMSTVRMLGNRAVLYAGDKPSIDLEAAMKASADVERYCAVHAERRHKRLDATGTTRRIYAGYYCTP